MLVAILTALPSIEYPIDGYTSILLFDLLITVISLPIPVGNTTPPPTVELVTILVSAVKTVAFNCVVPVLEIRLTVENDIAPPTYKFPPSPMPPDTVNAPVFVEVEAVALLIIVVPVTLKLPATPRTPLNAALPTCTDVPTTNDVPEITALLPINTLPPTPTPPVTIKAPVVVDTEVDVPLSVNVLTNDGPPALAPLLTNT